MSSFTHAVLISILLAGAFAGLKKIVIPKCCGKDELLTGDNLCIQNHGATWNISVFGNRTLKLFQNILPSHWQLRYSTRPDCPHGPKIVDLAAKNFLPTMNGSLLRVEVWSMMPPKAFCLDYQFMVVCLESWASPVKECCGNGAVYSESNGTCTRATDPKYELSLGLGAVKKLGMGFPSCANRKGEFALTGKLNESQIFANGSIWLEESKMLVGAGNYCLEHVLEHNDSTASVFICSDQLPIRTKIETAPGQRDLRFVLYPVGLAIGAIFLAATLLAGSTLPANHHVLHWSCQTNHVACLLVGNILLCITHLSVKMAHWPCFFIAVTMHFCFLAAFFWLNTMCFNIWWTFRDLRPQNTEKSQERLRLRLYEAYAWGIPFIITSIAAILDLVPINESNFLRPKFAIDKCWFYGDTEILTFFYGPIGILLFINLLLFALTARELTCGLWKRELVKSTTERAALGRVCMKLVVVMGITWIADIISWAAGGPHYLWYASDIINCIQGVFIFIVVGLQPQVLAAVKRAWCLRKHRQNIAGTTNHHSSSSQGMPSMGDTITNTNSVTNNTTKSLALESC